MGEFRTSTTSRPRTFGFVLGLAITSTACLPEDGGSGDGDEPDAGGPGRVSRDGGPRADDIDAGTSTDRGPTTGGPATTLEELLSVAPLEPRIEAAEATTGRLSYFIPGGWTRTEYMGAVLLQSPVAGDEPPCQIWLLDPIRTPSGATAQWETLLASVQTLYGPGTRFTAEFLDNPFADAKYGRSPSGYAFVGLRLTAVNVAAVNAYLAVFGSEAVPVVEHQPFGARCDIIGPSTVGIDAALVFHSLWLEGYEPAQVGLLPELIGRWTLLDASGGALTIFGANGQYIIALGTSGRVIENGVLYDVTSTWAGDGAWSNIGPVLAYLGPRSPRSTLARIHAEVNSTAPTGWITMLCETGVGTDGSSYETCQRKAPD